MEIVPRYEETVQEVGPASVNHSIRLQSRNSWRPYDGVLADMEDRIDNINESLTRERVINEKRCIFRLPIRLKDINSKYLVPQAVTLGPIHHGDTRLQMMEELKWRCFASFMETRREKLEECLIELGRLEGEIRGCYNDHMDESTGWLLQMLVVDGIFILTLLICLVPDELDNLLNGLDSVTLAKVYGDMLLLENQIPSIVLETLFRICFLHDMPLFVIATRFLRFIKVIPYTINMPESLEWLHLLDLFRLLLISHGHNEEMRRTYNRSISPIPCVTKLCRVGIKVNQHMTDSFLDVKFKNGVIEMPAIILDDSIMCSLLVNCVAYEQSCNISKHFSIYATLLDCLINTARDIDYLCDRRVIDNFFGTDAEAAQFINNLGKDLTLREDGDNHNFILFNFFGDVDECYRKRLNWDKWMSFKREYFGKPWLLISAFVGFVLLSFAFLQTFYTIYAYYVHHKN